MTQDPSTHGAPPADPTAEPSTGAGFGDLDGLDDLPVAEHVERFTRVHDALRARLDGAPDDGGHDGGADAGPRR